MVYLKLNHTGLQADQGASRTNDCSMTSTALQWAVLARKVTPGLVFFKCLGCGNLAMIAIRRNLPYIGLCFTEKHAP